METIVSFLRPYFYTLAKLSMKTNSDCCTISANPSSDLTNMVRFATRGIAAKLSQSLIHPTKFTRMSADENDKHKVIPLKPSFGSKPERVSTRQSIGTIQTLSERRSLTPLNVHPNAFVPGRWMEPACSVLSEETGVELHNLDHESKMDSESNCDDSSTDKFYEASEGHTYPPSARYSIPVMSAALKDDVHPLSAALDDYIPHVKPHMTRALLPNDAPLDFSCLEDQKGKTNVHSATPLARVWEFNSKTDIYECSLLNILADEFENIQSKKQTSEPNLWELIKTYTVGLSDDEFDEWYPWAKYSIWGKQKDGAEL